MKTFKITYIPDKISAEDGFIAQIEVVRAKSDIEALKKVVIKKAKWCVNLFERNDVDVKKILNNLMLHNLVFTIQEI